MSILSNVFVFAASLFMGDPCTHLEAEALHVQAAAKTLNRPDLERFFQENDLAEMVAWGNALDDWREAAEFGEDLCSISELLVEAKPRKQSGDSDEGSKPKQ